MTQERPHQDTAPARDRTVDVAPSKPSRPVPRAAEPAPQPIDVELDDDVRAPHPGPSATEILPDAERSAELTEDWSALGAASRTSVELLGAAAATNASLSAGGARTPLAGVPAVPDAAHAADVDFEAEATPFVPRFAPVAPQVRPASSADAAASVAAASVPLAPGWEAAAGTTPPDRDAAPATPAAPDVPLPTADAPLYRPRVAPGAVEAQAAPGDEEPPDRATVEEDAPREPARTVPLIIIGLAILAAVTGAVAWALLRPETVELPAQKVVASPEQEAPALEPISPADPGPFLAAMPTTAGTWALTAAVAGEALTDAALPGRVAEVHTLTYEDGVDTVTVVARQLYTEDDAVAALTAAAGADTPLTEATAGPTVVGSRAEISADGSVRILWTNGAAYFEAEGPAGTTEALVAALGL